jgi:hypothetical protein
VTSLFSTRYRTIVADPPWHYPHGHPAREHKKHPYPTMTLGELCALPVSDWADQSSHLYLWTTNEHLRYAFSVLGAWGFTFKNVITWCKPGLGMGGTFRNSSEIVLLGERGKCDLKRRDVGTWHVWPKSQENSRSPTHSSTSWSPSATAVPRDVRPSQPPRLGHVGQREPSAYRLHDCRSAVYLTPAEVLALVDAIETAKRWCASGDIEAVPEGEQVSYEAMEATLARFE